MYRYTFSLITASLCFCSSHAFGVDEVLVFDSFLDKTAKHSSGSSTPNFKNVFINAKGNVLFTETGEQHKPTLYHWTQNNGLDEIDIHHGILAFGFEPTKFSPSVTTFKYWAFHFDDSENVFIKFQHKTPDTVPSHPNRKNWQYKIGVWNEGHGFRVIKLPDIDDVSDVRISEEKMIVTGVSNSFKDRIVILELPKNLWDNNTTEDENEGSKTTTIDSPWENMPLGEVGARLYAIEQLFKHPKSKKERKYIAHIVESEAAHVLDSLQYQAKKAELLIDRANQEGVENPQAEKDYSDSMEAIEELRKMLKNMPIKNTKVFSLNLPSSKWEPTEK